MELEHCIGYASRVAGGLLYHPNGVEYVHVTGSCVGALRVMTVLAPHSRWREWGALVCACNGHFNKMPARVRAQWSATSLTPTSSASCAGMTTP